MIVWNMPENLIFFIGDTKLELVLPLCEHSLSYEVRDAASPISNSFIVFDDSTRILSIYVAVGGATLTKTLEYAAIGLYSEKIKSFTVTITEYTA